MILLFGAVQAHTLVDGDVAPVCDFDVVSATLPAQGETDVAVDVVPTFFLQDCGAPVSSAVARVTAGGALVLEERVEDHGRVHSLLEVPVELEPDTDYEIWLEPSSGGEEIGLSFSTGDRLAVSGAGAPEVTEGPEWTWYRSSDIASFFLMFEADQDPEGVSYVEAIGPDDEIWGTMLMTQEGPHSLSGDVFQESRPSDVCLTLSHRQADGSFVEGDTVCDDGRVGCATGGLAAGLLPALFGLLLARRRRCS